VVLAALAHLVYEIWRKKNNSYWQQSVHTVQHTIDQICYNVKSRAISTMRKKIAIADKNWINRL
jgi:hypothetical protein